MTGNVERAADTWAREHDSDVINGGASCHLSEYFRLTLVRQHSETNTSHSTSHGVTMREAIMSHKAISNFETNMSHAVITLDD